MNKLILLHTKIIKTILKIRVLNSSKQVKMVPVRFPLTHLPLCICYIYPKEITHQPLCYNTLAPKKYHFCPKDLLHQAHYSLMNMLFKFEEKKLNAGDLEKISNRNYFSLHKFIIVCVSKFFSYEVTWLLQMLEGYFKFLWSHPGCVLNHVDFSSTICTEKKLGHVDLLLCDKNPFRLFQMKFHMRDSHV